MLSRSTTARARLLAVNSPEQEVEWARAIVDGLKVLRVGTVDQTLLAAGRRRHAHRLGLCLCRRARRRRPRRPSARRHRCSIASSSAGTLPERDDVRMPRAANDRCPAWRSRFDLGRGRRRAGLAAPHDRLRRDLRASSSSAGSCGPTGGATERRLDDLLESAERDYADLVRRCEAFDAELMADLTRAGGERYAQMAALAYRQALAGCGLAADANKQPMLFAKENSSNGCVATVDVIYPAAPQFLLMGPTYAKALVAPALVYSTSPRWKFPFAPHDVGTYPQANGQVYGGGENSTNEADMMPVEESANLILLCAAIARMEGNADFASPWWPQLTRWEAYLEKYGEDPENQLCTDDFMGHLAHNANLSVKAILAIAAYGELCRMRGDAAAATKYHAHRAREYARHWMKIAADGDHYRIAFDKPNTWSQKYNLVWDKLLGLDVFPPEVARKRSPTTRRGSSATACRSIRAPASPRPTGASGRATLADDRGRLRGDRVADLRLPERHDRAVAVCGLVCHRQSPAATACVPGPVIGGVFIKMLEDPGDLEEVGEPRPGESSATRRPRRCRRESPSWCRPLSTSRSPGAITFAKPAADWAQPGFDDSQWKQGPGGFGTNGTPGAVVGTTWDTPDIWLRREVTLPVQTDPSRIQLRLYHDEDVEVYVDGVLAARQAGYITAYEPVEIQPAARVRY